MAIRELLHNLVQLGWRYNEDVPRILTAQILTRFPDSAPEVASVLHEGMVLPGTAARSWGALWGVDFCAHQAFWSIAETLYEHGHQALLSPEYRQKSREILEGWLTGSSWQDYQAIRALGVIPRLLRGMVRTEEDGDFWLRHLLRRMPLLLRYAREQPRAMRGIFEALFADLGKILGAKLFAADDAQRLLCLILTPAEWVQPYAAYVADCCPERSYWRSRERWRTAEALALLSGERAVAARLLAAKVAMPASQESYGGAQVLQALIADHPPRNLTYVANWLCSVGTACGLETARALLPQLQRWGLRARHLEWLIGTWVGTPARKVNTDRVMDLLRTALQIWEGLPDRDETYLSANISDLVRLRQVFPDFLRGLPLTPYIDLYRHGYSAAVKLEYDLRCGLQPQGYAAHLLRQALVRCQSPEHAELLLKAMDEIDRGDDIMDHYLFSPLVQVHPAVDQTILQWLHRHGDTNLSALWLQLAPPGDVVEYIPQATIRERGVPLARCVASGSVLSPTPDVLAMVTGVYLTPTNDKEVGFQLARTFLQLWGEQEILIMGDRMQLIW